MLAPILCTLKSSVHSVVRPYFSPTVEQIQTLQSKETNRVIDGYTVADNGSGNTGTELETHRDR